MYLEHFTNLIVDGSGSNKQSTMDAFGTLEEVSSFQSPSSICDKQEQCLGCRVQMLPLDIG